MIVFTYPGQGSQFSGMGSSWMKHPSWELIEEASDATHVDLKELLLNSDDNSLRQTENAQLSTFVLSMFMATILMLLLPKTQHPQNMVKMYIAFSFLP